MPTTARVIFRGLTAFLWDKNNERMVAVPVTGPLCGHDRLQVPARDHVHLPRVEWVGHRADNRHGWNRVTQPFGGTLSFAWDPDLDDNRVARTQTFEEHVPSYADLGAHGDPNPNALRHFRDDVPSLFESLTPSQIQEIPSVAAVVHCDAGSRRYGEDCAAEMEVTDVVRFWRSPARRDGPATPKVHQPVHFAGGVVDPDRSWYLASECTLRFHHPCDDARFVITTTTDRPRRRRRRKELARLQSWRLDRGPYPQHPDPAHPARHDLFVDDIEVLVTSYSGRVSEPLPFSAHYQWLFDLHRNGPDSTLR